MSDKFSKMPRITYSGLDYNTIMEDIIEIVKDNPEYNESLGDFFSSNAGRMIIELFAYITDQLATRIDWIANENFISTATEKKSIIRLLKLIGYSFSLTSPAKVKFSINGPSSDFSFKEECTDFSNNSNVRPFFIKALDNNGNSTIFEAVNYSSENEINYQDRLIVIPEDGAIFSQGETKIYNYVKQNNSGETFTLSEDNILQNSIVICKIDELTGFGEKLIQVNSFLEPKAQSTSESGQPAYKLSVNENNFITVEFPSSSIVPIEGKRLGPGEKIRVYYRVGNGKIGNIPAYSVNTSKKLTVY